MVDTLLRCFEIMFVLVQNMTRADWRLRSRSVMASPLIALLAFGQTILVQYDESILFVLGTTGSILNIFLFSQRKLYGQSHVALVSRSMSSKHIERSVVDLFASSVATIALLLIGIILQLYALNHTPNSLFNRHFCKARTYIGQSCAMLCRWLLTVACIDRCLFISNNFGLRLWSTVHTARKMVLFFSIIWMIIPIHTLIFGDVRRAGYLICVMATNASVFYHTIHAIITRGLTPLLIMLICPKVIWKSLRL